jgi:hypothetical protein
MAKRKAAKRKLINTGTDKRYVLRVRYQIQIPSPSGTWLAPSRDAANNGPNQTP